MSPTEFNSFQLLLVLPTKPCLLTSIIPFSNGSFLLGMGLFNSKFSYQPRHTCFPSPLLEYLIFNTIEENPYFILIFIKIR